MKSFDECIQCHETFDKRNCHAPVELLRSMKNNKITRARAGWSASTLLSCPRSVALLENNDYYEPLHTGWNKARGTYLHAMLEAEMEEDENVIAEVRVEKYHDGIRITGKPDKVYKKQGVIIDYKSKYRLPTKPDPNHEAQMNIYAWLLRGGRLLYDDGREEDCDIRIVKGGMLYITWNTPEGEQFLKMGYPIWNDVRMNQFLDARIAPLKAWKETGQLPACNPYIRGYWKCDCEKIETQLAERGEDAPI
jgi:hypothetical protein